MFKRIESSKKLFPRPRHGHKSVVLQDRFLVSYGGGNDGIFNELMVFDLKTETWGAPSKTEGLETPPPPGGIAAYACYGGSYCGHVLDEKERENIEGTYSFKSEMYLFGGMKNDGTYAGDLYKLTCTPHSHPDTDEEQSEESKGNSSNNSVFDMYEWWWEKMESKGEVPTARLGSCLVRYGNHLYIFGGLRVLYKERVQDSEVQYYNDSYSYDISAQEWKRLQTTGDTPSMRESHTGVLYNGSLVVYGGMNGERLCDAYSLDLHTLEWKHLKYSGEARPVGRSLHSAVLVDDEMYVFGGWIRSEDSTSRGQEWKCSGMLAKLNLISLEWHVFLYAESEPCARSRAGHSSAAHAGKFYIFSGRDGYKKAWSNQVCTKDLWAVDTRPPSKPSNVICPKVSCRKIYLHWEYFQNAEGSVPCAYQVVLGCRTKNCSPEWNGKSAVGGYDFLSSSRRVRSSGESVSSGRRRNKVGEGISTKRVIDCLEHLVRVDMEGGDDDIKWISCCLTEGWEYVIDKFIKPATEYFIRVRSVNKCGLSDFTDTLKVTSRLLSVPDPCRIIRTTEDANNDLCITLEESPENGGCQVKEFVCYAAAAKLDGGKIVPFERPSKSSQEGKQSGENNEKFPEPEFIFKTVFRGPSLGVVPRSCFDQNMLSRMILKVTCVNNIGEGGGTKRAYKWKSLAHAPQQENMGEATKVREVPPLRSMQEENSSAIVKGDIEASLECSEEHLSPSMLEPVSKKRKISGEGSGKDSGTASLCDLRCDIGSQDAPVQEKKKSKDEDDQSSSSAFALAGKLATIASSL
eukprot:Nk52_evm4s370 gene=Nk52_evmTU4s370